MMKVSHRYIALKLLVILTFVNAGAQVRTDYMIGLNISTMSINTPGVSYQMGSRIGMRFGEIFNIALTDHFALQPGIMLSSKGAKYKIDNAEYTFSPTYFELPFDLALSFGSETVKVTFLGGAYLAYGVGGYKIDPDGNFKFLNYGKSGVRDAKPLDVGLASGLGLKIKNFLLTAEYSKGFRNLSVSEIAGSDIKNRVLGISITAVFRER